MAQHTKIEMPFAKWPRIVTPTGVAVFPKLNEPDYGSKAFPKPKGEYNLTFRLPVDEAAPLIARIEAFHAEAAEAQQKSLPSGRKLKVYDGRPFADAEDRKKGGVREALPGFVDFKLKRAAKRTVKGKDVPQSIQLTDAAGDPVTQLVFGGSKVRCAALIKPWFTAALGLGVSLELHGVKVIELVTAGGALAMSEFEGFASAEEGYRAPAPAPASDDSVTGSDEGQGDDDAAPADDTDEF